MSHKDLVKAWVPKVRSDLQDDFANELQRLGFETDGKILPVDGLKLGEADRAARTRLVALLTRETKLEGDGARGFESVRRELTFTFLNRLVGLKCMEARDLLFLPPPGNPNAAAEETRILTPVPGQSLSPYLRDLRAAAGARLKYAADADEQLWREGLTAAFRAVTQEIALLFDPGHEYSCLWPTHGALKALIDAINTGLPMEAYQARDFLGWVYQFFNRVEKKKVRDETKGIPRSPYELSVINQFYTPPWVVKALVDNTLGRLWVQMHPDTRLCPRAPPPYPKDRPADLVAADYLVPGTGAALRYQALGEDGELRGFKLAKEIRLLDPACGTMHFGQYAYGLFQAMYLEEIENAGKPGWPTEPSVADPTLVPLAILEHNLFGVDIDPRAIQIASLSLLMTVKESLVGLGADPRAQRVRGMNLAVASGVDLGKERLRGLLQGLKLPKVNFGLATRLLEVLWLNFSRLNELGSLVQIEESVRAVLQEWVEGRKPGVAGVAGRGQDERLPIFFDQLDQGTIVEADRADRQAKAEEIYRALIAALETAAAETTLDATDRLFAEDTARGVKLLRILGQRYDIVVMNPPYGDFIPTVKDLVKRLYPLTKNDIYAAFLDRAGRMIEPEGYVGALVSSTFKTNTTFEKLRTEILLKRNPMAVMLDLGVGILDDAMVEAAALVLRGAPA